MSIIEEPNMHDVAFKNLLDTIKPKNLEDDCNSRLQKLKQLGKEPFVEFCKGIVDGAALNDIYHSETLHEMQIKLALYGLKLTEQDHIWLCNTLTYHYGYWPHTRKRFEAYC